MEKKVTETLTETCPSRSKDGGADCDTGRNDDTNENTNENSDDEKSDQRDKRFLPDMMTDPTQNQQPLPSRDEISIRGKRFLTLHNNHQAVFVLLPRYQACHKMMVHAPISLNATRFCITTVDNLYCTDFLKPRSPVKTSNGSPLHWLSLALTGSHWLSGTFAGS